MPGNNKHYPGLGIARLTFTLSDRGRELPRENRIHCKFHSRTKEDGTSLVPPVFSSDPSHLFLSRATGFAREPMDSRFRRETRETGTRRTSRSTDTCLVTRARCVTCRRVNTASCHKQKNIESNSPSTEPHRRHRRTFIAQGQSGTRRISRRSEMRVRSRLDDIRLKTRVFRRYRLARSRRAIARAARTSVAGAPALRGTYKCLIAIKRRGCTSPPYNRTRVPHRAARRETATYVRACSPPVPSPPLFTLVNTSSEKRENERENVAHIRVLLARRTLSRSP